MATLTRELARAAATDAGTRHAKANGRTDWNDADYTAAVAEFARLWPAERDR